MGISSGGGGGGGAGLSTTIEQAGNEKLLPIKENRSKAEEACKMIIDQGRNNTSNYQ